MARTATRQKNAGKQPTHKPTAIRKAKASQPAKAARKTSPARTAKKPRSASTASKPKTAAKQTREQTALRSARRTGRAARQGLPTRKPAPQRFTVSHHQETDFKADGLRSYALYRDLGIAAATEGLCQAHVIRFLGPCTDEVRKRHYHDTELQLIYVLKGWIRNEFEGHGEQLMQAGSCWLQPPGIEHTVLDFSDDCEVLEIIVPADFGTVELAR